ncbi:hypothetical protein, variant 2 [Exophiala mesophila]|nr:hypothetical protein, variant 1 [Exophiala mesophila]XP_016223855.1 hypothetical protein, variant 2 [Exophiala mesophila]KIV92280.1 hypothetical protein, variant 1 [Exophiala mesophila]KIV92281.1 hypothetical protein, variant 2 [Exophiala mesophila]
MPATHGDPALAFHDLPAANLMPLIVPNSAQSIRPEDVRPLRFSAGPADESLVNALKDFLADIDREDEAATRTDSDDMLHEMDEMGQLLDHDEAGDPRRDTYYGWSLAFCEKMKARGKENPDSSSRQSRSRSSSQSRGRNYQKRRRYSRSSSGHSRSSRSSRSRSRDQLSPRRRTFRSRDRRKDRSRSRSYSPSRPPSFPQNPNTADRNNFLASSVPFPPPPPPLAQGMAFPPPPPLLHPGGFPIPPPPPPNWKGEWPPAPPGLHFPVAPPPPPAINPSHTTTRSPFQPRYDGNMGGYGR